MSRSYYEKKFNILKKGVNNSIVLFKPDEDLTIMGFSGRAERKPNFYITFSNLEKRDKYINDFFKSQENIIKKKEEERQKRIEITNENIEIGKIYYTSWGYEQTNGEFYQVVARKGKKTLILREIYSSQVTSGRDCGTFEPVKDNFVSEETFETRVDSLKIGESYKKSLHVYDNKPVYRSWYY